MNVKKYLIASVVVAVAAWVLDFILHGVILMPYYEKYAHLFGRWNRWESICSLSR